MKRFVSLFVLIAMIAGLFTANTMVFAKERTPYKDHTLPCEINIADFDDGDYGVSFKGPDSKTSNYVYRSGYAVNFYNGGENGPCVSASPGQWYRYTVNVEKDSEFDVYLFYGTSAASKSRVTVSFDDTVDLQTLLVQTGGYDIIGETQLGTVELKKGKHDILVGISGATSWLNKLVFKTESSQDITFAKKTGAYKNIYLPAVIEGENYDLSGNVSLDNENSYKEYRKDGVLDITDIDKGYAVEINSGEEALYTFNVLQSGVYGLSMAADNKKDVEIYFDDNAVPYTASYTNSEYTEQFMDRIYLPKGTHKMRVKSGTKTRIDYFRFTCANSENYYTLDNLKKPEVSEDDENEEFITYDTDNPVWKELYVSVNGSENPDGTKENPFGSIETVRDYIRTVRKDMSGDIIVNIMPGMYKVADEVEFCSEDSGINGFNVIYRGYDSENQPVFYAGERITGWKQTDKNEIWYADASVIDDTRDLYINDYPAKRARSKYKYHAIDEITVSDSLGTGFKISADNVPVFENAADIELVWNLEWTAQRTPVKNIVLNKDRTYTLYMDEPYWKWSSTRSASAIMIPGAGNDFYFENAMELLDEPGEFFFDKTDKKIYYYPLNGEDLSSAQTYVGTLNRMFVVEGTDASDKIQNIRFENITFKYGSSTQINTKGNVISQADKNYNGLYEVSAKGGILEPCIVDVNYANNVIFKNNRFVAVGSGAIAFTNGVTSSIIEGNVFTDVAGTAVIIDHWGHTDTSESGEMERVKNVLVANNVIRRAACQYRSGCGISLYYPANVKVVHNDIKDVPYTGITLGWGWGANDVSTCVNNEIAYNRIENVMNPQRDGGHIYTLGAMPGTRIHHNYMIKSDYKAGGIYFDQGSAYLMADYNVIEDCENWFHGNYFSATGKAHDNTLDNNYTDTENLINDGKLAVVSNTHYETEWSDEALEIISKSGVEDSYSDNLNGVEKPNWHLNYITDVPRYLYSPKTETHIESQYYTGYYKVGGGEPRVTSSSGTIVIGYTSPGDWFEYNLNVKDTGKYYLGISGADGWTASDPPCQVSIYVDGVKLVDSETLIRTGSFRFNLEHLYGPFDMTEGTHTVKVEMLSKEWSFHEVILKPYYEGTSGLNEEAFDEGVIIYEEDVRGFMDIDEHWAEDSILNMTQIGIVNGVSKNSFAPDSYVSVYESSIMALRALSMYDDADWKKMAIEMKFITENENDTPITRERFYDIVMKAHKYLKGSYQVEISDKKVFTDEDNIAVEYQNAVNGAVLLGYATGYSDKTFLPKNYLTRAEAVVVFERLLNK